MRLACPLSSGSCLTGCRESMTERWGWRAQEWTEVRKEAMGSEVSRSPVNGCAVLDGVHVWVTGKPVTVDGRCYWTVLTSCASVARKWALRGGWGCCTVLCSGSCELCD